MTPQMTDQAELVDRKFVDVEVEKAINPIQDYEKVRFMPVYFPNINNTSTYTPLRNITYNVKFLSTIGFPTVQSNYSDIGIVDDDIKFGKKRFEESFLNLSFYDSDRATDQRLISIINIFPRITDSDIQDNSDPTPGLPKPASQIPVSFTLSSPILNPEGFAEGFYVYNFKDEVTATLPKELYMRARFNNAANGSILNMMTDGVPYYIDDLVNKLYTKYVLYRDNTGYFYAIDETYSNNVTRVGDNIIVDIYEIQAL
jgi:hypothetical protein